MKKIVSPHSFTDTRARLLKAIAENHLLLFAEFDHTKAAQDAGLSLAPTTVIVFGNPKAGTPLMSHFPELALDLPFRVLIREADEGEVWVGFHPAESLQIAGMDDAAVQTLKGLEKLLLNAL